MKKIFLFIVYFFLFIGCLKKDIKINKEFIIHENGLTLKINVISAYKGMEDPTELNGNIQIENTGKRNSQINISRLGLKINNIYCKVDDNWKRLLFDFEIEPNATYNFEVRWFYLNKFSISDINSIKPNW